MASLSDLPGLELWVPPKAPMTDKDLPAYEIIGSDGQIVQIPIAPGEAVTCDKGSMCYSSDRVKMEAKFLGFMKTLGRIAGGGNLFSVTYTNEGDELGYVAMTPTVPGLVVPIDMTEYPEILASRDSYLCSFGTGEDTVVSATFNPASSAAACLCGGEGIIMQNIIGGTTSFLVAMGTVIIKTLEAGEEIIVDTDAILAFTRGVEFDVRLAANCCSLNMCCGGEGVFNTVLTGPGKVWLESMSISRLRALFPPRPDNSGGSGDDGDDGGDE